MNAAEVNAKYKSFAEVAKKNLDKAIKGGKAKTIAYRAIQLYIAQTTSDFFGDSLEDFQGEDLTQEFVESYMYDMGEETANEMSSYACSDLYDDLRKHFGGKKEVE